MKIKFVNRIAIVLTFLMVFTTLAIPLTYAVEEESTDSSHGNTNNCSTCLETGDTNGDCVVSAADSLAIINHMNTGEDYDACLDVNGDGVISAADSLIITNNINTGVSCDTTCSVSGSGQAEDVPTEELSGTSSDGEALPTEEVGTTISLYDSPGDDTVSSATVSSTSSSQNAVDSFFDIKYELEVEEETESEVMNLVGETSSGTVVETFSEIVNVIEEEVEEETSSGSGSVTDSGTVSEDIAEEAVDDMVDEIMEEIEDMTEDEAADELEEVQEEIEEEIDELADEAESDSANSDKYNKRIRLLKKLLAKLRAKSIKHHGEIIEKIKKVKNHRAIYFVRWGNLSGEYPDCSGISTDEITEALDDNTIYEICDVITADYDLNISVDHGELKVRHEVLFEENDSTTETSGSSIGADSFIAGHWDGWLVQYTPEEGHDQAVNVSISIGELNATYTGDETFGKKDIGNTHEIEITHIGKLISGLNISSQGKLILHKLAVAKKINNIREKLYRLHLLLGDENNDELENLEELIDKIDEYNFDETSSEEVQEDIDAVVDSLDTNITEEELQSLIDRLKNKFASLKEKAKSRKFSEGLIPFKDTDDSEWYTDYVSTVSSEGIISGYKDYAGNLLGEYRPGNNITIAEILKIALETSGNGEADGTPDLDSASSHWAKGYVKRAEKLNLDIVQDDSLDLNRPATRAEVIRVILESLGIQPDPVDTTGFFDVLTSHEHADYIAYAKDLGIVSGDDETGAFRPDDPINRAEAAKIASLIISIILGGVDS